MPDVVRFVVGQPNDSEEATITELIAYREIHPQSYGITPPPTNSIRIAGEFEPAESLLLAYVGYAEYDELIGDILEATYDQGRIDVLVNEENRGRFDSMLARRGIPQQVVNRIGDVPYDTIWMRDYGPQPVVTDSGLAFVDGRYFLNCVQDDAVPAHLARRARHTQVIRPNLWTEGGNLLSDGRGLCLTTIPMATQNELSQYRTSRVLRDYYGCQQTVFLEALEGNVVNHVDIFLYFASEQVILLGSADPLWDPVNHAILERNRSRLAALRTPEGEPFEVLRVPMPAVSDEDAADPVGFPVLTYLNMLAFNEVVLVPVYDTDLDVEDAALAVIEAAFPDRYIVPVVSDAIAYDGGTIHCITRTLPLVEI